MTLDNYISTILMTQCQEEIESLYQTRALTPDETRENLKKIREVFKNGIKITEDQVLKLVSEPGNEEGTSVFGLILMQLAIRLELESIMNYRQEIDLDDLENPDVMPKDVKQAYDIVNEEIRVRQRELMALADVIESKLSPNDVQEL